MKKEIEMLKYELNCVTTNLVSEKIEGWFLHGWDMEQNPASGYNSLAPVFLLIGAIADTAIILNRLSDGKLSILKWI